MALKRPTGAIGFMFRIKMQHYSCDFARVSTFRIRVEQAQIRDEVLLVVNGQYRIGGRGIGDIGIKRRLLHGLSRNRLVINQLCFGPWQIDDREAVGPKAALEKLGTVALEQRSAAGARLARGLYATTCAAVTLTG
jgi:hypothetical protein